MRPLTREIIKDLANEDPNTFKVSIYIRIYPYGQEAKKNSIRLKKQFNEISEKLPKQELSEAFLKNYELAEHLVTEIETWKDNYQGLGVFISENSFEYYRLSNETTDYNLIANYYYLAPLFGTLDHFGEYYILDLSQHHNRILKCNKFDCEEIEIKTPNWPHSLEELLSSMDRSESLQSHPSGSGQVQAHGHGKWKDKEIEDVRDYFRMIDDELKKELPEPFKLILATTKENFAIYKDQTRLDNVLDDFIEGNHKSTSSKELAGKGREISTQSSAANVENLLEKIEDEGPKDGKGTFDLKEIVKRVNEGAVQFAIIAENEHIYGKVDPTTFEIEMHEEQQKDSVDLLNYVASKTLENAGEVFLISADKMPDDAKVAAVFRY